MKQKTYRFMAEIKKVPDIDGAYVEFPYDVREEFGKGRVKVHATFDGEPYEGSLVRMKTENHIIGVRKDIQAAGRYHRSYNKGTRIKVTFHGLVRPTIQIDNQIYSMGSH